MRASGREVALWAATAARALLGEELDDVTPGVVTMAVEAAIAD